MKKANEKRIRVNGKTVGFVKKVAKGWVALLLITRTPSGSTFATEQEAERIVLLNAGVVR